ncbi:MAG TPA: arsenite methyltransferase [Cyclobacteriaceae bacterium]|nr:arsenite methyltransferase [Cyclobacteriaceae bacterium]
MKTSSENLKEIVREKYSEIAEQSKSQNESSCCGASCACNSLDISIMAESYEQLQGYVADADLGLGCGLPTEFAQIKAGDTVIDLGSGAGNDCFVARSITGASGKVIGIDMTPAMIDKARRNADKLGLNNVEFRLGDIENLPVHDNTADVIVSNCVLNLVPDKIKAFAETYRVLKPGGHISVSDIVLIGELPARLQNIAELYAGCVSGAIQKDAYLYIIKAAGFTEVKIQKERQILIPDEILSQYLEANEIKQLQENQVGIYSITVYAEKPLQP